MTQALEPLVTQLSKKLLTREWKMVTAESCTGGGLAYLLTSLAGSSNWFERGFVTYSNSSKEELLGVDGTILSTFGAVSEQTVREMAEGALRHSQAQISIAVTGIAGPDGGTKEKPVGTVWIGFASINAETRSFVNIFPGSRTEIREQTIETALKEILLNFLI
jgi:nicotinamide-nucleotide amidase